MIRIRFVCEDTKCNIRTLFLLKRKQNKKIETLMNEILPMLIHSSVDILLFSRVWHILTLTKALENPVCWFFGKRLPRTCSHIQCSAISSKRMTQILYSAQNHLGIVTINPHDLIYHRLVGYGIRIGVFCFWPKFSDLLFLHQWNIQLVMGQSVDE